MVASCQHGIAASRERDDAAIIRKLVLRRCESWPAEKFLLSRQAIHGEGVEIVREIARDRVDLRDDPILDLFARARTPGAIPTVRACRSVRMAGLDDLLRATAPHTTISVSLPGYSPDRTRAFIVISEYTGPLGAHAALVELRRVGDDWQIVRDVGLWEA